MATIKSYTDLEQSKKLAEILPLKSADMWYHGHYSPLESERKYDDEPCPFFHSVSPNWDKSCWSLASLLNILECGALFKTPQGWACQAYIVSKTETTNYYDNPIDACYEMILKLHEQKLL